MDQLGERAGERTSGTEVQMVDWPAQESLRQDLADRGVLRLLRIDADVGAPLLLDDGEDWIRVPCSDEDIAARMRTLQTRRISRTPRPPRIDEFGMLRVGRLRCVLAPIEARLMNVLLASGEGITSRAALADAGWPDVSVTRNALDLEIMRLRRRVEPLGMMIRTVRNRGYVIDFD